jgi:biopolymer transport protein TolQ
MFIGSFSLFNSYFEADFFGKLIFMFLFILSIVSWVIMVTKFKFTKKAKSNCRGFEAFFEKGKENILNLEGKNFSNNLNPYFEIYSCVKQKTVDILNKNNVVIPFPQMVIRNSN